MEMQRLITLATETAKAKGFNPANISTQLALIGLELAETLEHVTPSNDREVDFFNRTLQQAAERLEEYRRTAQDHMDISVLIHPGRFASELADLVLASFSLAGSLGMGLALQSAMLEKIVENAGRPHRHGKGF